MVVASRLAALLIFLIIAFSTLSPIGLRPHLGPADVERGGAYLLFGMALAMGFPDHVRRGMLIVICVAGVLEALQLIDPGRHGRLHDALVKAAAGIVGVAIVKVVSAAIRWARTASRT